MTWPACQCLPSLSVLHISAPTISRSLRRPPISPEPPCPLRAPHAARSRRPSPASCCSRRCGQDLPTVSNETGLAVSLVTPDILVSTTADDGPGSLRQAIADVADAGVIGFEPALAGGTIALTQRLIIDDKSLTIEGSVEDGITLDGDGVTGIFFVSSDGGLTLRNATLTGSHASSGAIASIGTVRVENSTIAGNHAVEMGAGGDGYGGGIGHFGGSVTVVNSTISGNVSDQRGGGIGGLASSGSVTLIHTTVTGNSAPDDESGGIFVGDGIDLTIQNSIIAGNTATAQPNCGLEQTSSFDRTYLGTNLLGDADCMPRLEDIVAADPVVRRSPTTAARPVPAPCSPAVRRSRPRSKGARRSRPTSATSPARREATATSAPSNSPASSCRPSRWMRAVPSTRALARRSCRAALPARRRQR